MKQIPFDVADVGVCGGEEFVRGTKSMGAYISPVAVIIFYLRAATVASDSLLRIHQKTGVNRRRMRVSSTFSSFYNTIVRFRRLPSCLPAHMFSSPAPSLYFLSQVSFRRRFVYKV